MQVDRIFGQCYQLSLNTTQTGLELEYSSGGSNERMQTTDIFDAYLTLHLANMLMRVQAREGDQLQRASRYVTNWLKRQLSPTSKDDTYDQDDPTTSIERTLLQKLDARASTHTPMPNGADNYLDELTNRVKARIFLDKVKRADNKGNVFTLNNGLYLIKKGSARTRDESTLALFARRVSGPFLEERVGYHCEQADYQFGERRERLTQEALAGKISQVICKDVFEAYQGEISSKLTALSQSNRTTFTRYLKQLRLSIGAMSRDTREHVVQLQELMRASIIHYMLSPDFTYTPEMLKGEPKNEATLTRREERCAEPVAQPKPQPRQTPGMRVMKRRRRSS